MNLTYHLIEEASKAECHLNAKVQAYQLAF